MTCFQRGVRFAVGRASLDVAEEGNEEKRVAGERRQSGDGVAGSLGQMVQRQDAEVGGRCRLLLGQAAGRFGRAQRRVPHEQTVDVAAAAVAGVQDAPCQSDRRRVDGSRLVQSQERR